LAILASIGSTAPFVGLFGTVWGILHALVDIGRTGSASLEVVAGPIGEALIATGLGIGVAVPAVLAYNFFVRRLKISAAYLDDFATDYIKITRKAAFRLKVVESNVVGGKKSKDAEASNISETSQGVYA
jgi:biopolymer transport protein ExbB